MFDPAHDYYTLDASTLQPGFVWALEKKWSTVYYTRTLSGIAPVLVVFREGWWTAMTWERRR